jgi:hypothetical protein
MLKFSEVAPDNVVVYYSVLTKSLYMWTISIHNSTVISPILHSKFIIISQLDYIIINEEELNTKVYLRK